VKVAARAAPLLGLVLLLLACGSTERAHAPARDAGPPPRPTKLPADGGLFVEPDRPVEDLGRDILRDMGRLDAHGSLRADQVTIGAAYRYRFAFTQDEVPEGHEALAIPVAVRNPPADLSLARFGLVDARGRPVAEDPIVEWLDPTGGTIVPPPALPPTDEQHLLLVYFVPDGLSGGALRYGAATIGPVRRGARGPVRPRSSCTLTGAFGYAPIPRELLLEIEVADAFVTWDPGGTSVTTGDATPTRCKGFRRLDARGHLIEWGAQAPATPAFVPRARFLAVYDLPEGEVPGSLRWEGTDCDSTPVPERGPLPERLGPERGPPRLQSPDAEPPPSPGP